MLVKKHREMIIFDAVSVSSSNIYADLLLLNNSHPFLSYILFPHFHTSTNLHTNPAFLLRYSQHVHFPVFIFTHQSKFFFFRLHFSSPQITTNLSTMLFQLTSHKRPHFLLHGEFHYFSHTCLAYLRNHLIIYTYPNPKSPFKIFHIKSLFI
ncbi:unnamed protein product [Meloidogyne enterolobii]|uniref:Uncharacterized protein n=1 Tax=Meloidogyne enterolobii TaxID=390850 RepID=A0ACB1B3T4_MELEN